MSNQKEANNEKADFNESGIEKFPKPRTMPSQWDVSGLMPTKSGTQDKASGSEEIFEKFPKPRTMPIHWDTSVLNKKSQ